jgi:hypothetical protein
LSSFKISRAKKSSTEVLLFILYLIPIVILEGFSKATNTNKIEAKNAEKAQFTVVNEHFEAFFNEDIGSRMGFAKASIIPTQ